MNNEILEILKRPYSVDPQQVEKLELLITDYPYFQPLYFVLLKYYKTKNYFKYTNLLNRCILHISNRKLLYIFLNSEQDTYFAEPSPGQKLATDKTDDESQKQTSIEYDKQSSTTNTDETLFTSRRDKNTLQEAIAETVLANTTAEIDNKLEKTLLPEINFELDENFEIIKPSDDDISTFSFIQTEEKKENVIINEPIIELESEQVNEEITKKVKDIQPINIEPEDDTKTDKAANPNYIKAKEQISIIDKFLEELPNIKPTPVNTSAVQEDISQASVVEHEDFMTETLAKIFIKQGNYDKAIEIYKKLILKFPEKNAYFASQINELENLKNNQ